MLIRFGIGNYRSYNEMQYIDMVKGSQHKSTHPEQLIKTNSGVDLIRYSSIFGKNGSGKSNLVKALGISSLIVKNGNASKYLRFNDRYRILESDENFKFEYNIALGNFNYIYYVEINYKTSNIVKESLKGIHLDNEFYVFERDEKISFSDLEIDELSKYRMDIYALDFLRRKDQPFLFSIGRLKIDDDYFKHYNAVYNFFVNSLLIINQDDAMTIQDIIINDDSLTKMEEFIKEYDVGIGRIKKEKIGIDELREYLNFEHDVDHIINSYKLNPIGKHVITNIGGRNNNKFVLTCELDPNGEFSFEILKYEYIMETDFDYNEYSTGTKKIIDLMGIFFSNYTCIVIDEIGRSFHHELTKYFIKKFLETKKDSQLIVTTHDTLLMDLEEFRRESYNIVNISNKGESIIRNIEEYKVRFDKKISKAYKEGRFDGIPNLGRKIVE